MQLSSRPINLAPNPDLTIGPGVVQQLPDVLRTLGGTRVFVMADPGVVAAGLMAPILVSLDAAGMDHVEFSAIEPNPTEVNVAAGVAVLSAFGPDAVVLLGGGSAMDCGKYVALAAANGSVGDLGFAFHVRTDDNDLVDFTSLVPPQVPEHDACPIVAIPTTSGTASETNGGGLITDTATSRKLTFTHDSLKPRAVLLDPLLTLGLPPGPTATCGMDALTHAIEAFTSNQASPYADALALGAIRMIATWLPVVIDEPADLEARAQVQLASHMAGIAFSSGALLGLVHAMGHPVSGHLHQPHGQTLATLLPHVMRFNVEVCDARYCAVGTALGTTDNASAAIDAVEGLSARVGTDRTLGDLGATTDLIPALVDDALSDLMILTSPRYPSRAEIGELYRVAL